jgi:hypothetical protein
MRVHGERRTGVGLFAAGAALGCRMSRRASWWIGCLALACVAGPPPPTPPVDAPQPPETAPAPMQRQRLVPFTGAGLAIPDGHDAADLEAAAAAASRAGVLDVAAYWREQVQALDPSPARARALADAREALGLPAAMRPLAPLDGELARALRAAVEAHAWDRVLALTGPALAAAPHHELYLWTGDALWQQGRASEARRMWSRARALLRAAGVAMTPRYGGAMPARQLAWSRGGLAFVRRDHGWGWLEVWDDRAERPWRRWAVAGPRSLAWAADGAVLANSEVAYTADDAADEMRLVLRDPANGATLAAAIPYAGAEWIDRIAGAESAPVFVTSGMRTGELRAWAWSPGGGLASTHALAGGKSAQFALDAAGTRLAIARPGYPLELVALATGESRSLGDTVRSWQVLRFLADDTLIAADDQAAVLRATLAPDAQPRLERLVDADTGLVDPQIKAIACSSQGLVAGVHKTEKSGSELVVCDGAASCQGSMIAYAREAAFSPDGDRLASVDYHELSVQDVAGLLPARILRRPVEHLAIAGVAAGGSAIAIEQRYRGLVIWDTRTGARLLHRSSSGFLGFSPDGGSVALRGAEFNRVEVHPLAGGSAEVFDTEGERIHGVAFSPDGRRLAIATAERLGVWDTGDGSELWRAANPHHASELAFTARGELVYASEVGLHVRDAAGSGRPRTLLRRASGVTNWSLAPGGDRVIVCMDHDIGSRIVDVRTGRALRRLPGLCGAAFVADAALMSADPLYPATIDLRTGTRHTAKEPIGSSLIQVNAAVILAGKFDERGSLAVLSPAGDLQATIHPREDLGWLVSTVHGAVDGDPAAHLTVDTQVDRGAASQLYPASLAWDGAHVPGLLLRLFAGEAVRPPVPR